MTLLCMTGIIVGVNRIPGRWVPISLPETTGATSVGSGYPKRNDPGRMGIFRGGLNPTWAWSRMLGYRIGKLTPGHATNRSARPCVLTSVTYANAEASGGKELRRRI